MGDAGSGCKVMLQYKLALMCLIMAVAFAAALMAAGPSSAQTQESKGPLRYVGSEKCKECHEDQYESYRKHSKKAHSFKSVEVMARGLTAQEIKKCYECHTTGYGKPGGFRSVSETPHLKNAGCESCHGPGSRHASSEDVADIKAKLEVEDCTSCHNEERVGAFRYRPLIYGGGH
jgi:cytochrome c553